VNSKLVLELRTIIRKLGETVGDRLMLGAYQRAEELYERARHSGFCAFEPA